MIFRVDENLTDEQQAQIARNWFRENGSFVFGGILLAVGGLFGWNQWQDYAIVQAERASALYEEIALAVRSGRVSQADELLFDLDREYASSPYIDQARLIIAKSYMERNDFEAAAGQLAAIVASSEYDEMRHIAKLRLARVRLQQRRLDDALEVIGELTPESAFAAQYANVRGDIFYAMERVDEARTAYQLALVSDPQSSVIDRVFVQAKLDSLGVVDSTPSVAIEPAPEPAE
ncbi:MAG: tetratricopeptide repeat protein [Gammaproteobacteria bacterium]|nr:MAG: tetratricopeptide repeat protein [Gammaproteobacteria bacterium]